MQLGHRECWSCGGRRDPLPTHSPREAGTHHQHRWSGEARPCSIPGRGQGVAGDRSLRLAEVGGRGNPLHPGRLPPLYSPLGPRLPALSFPASPAARLLAHRALFPFLSPRQASSPSCSPRSHSSPAPPAFSLFKSILSQRRVGKYGAGDSRANALESGLSFLPQWKWQRAQGALSRARGSPRTAPHTALGRLGGGAQNSGEERAVAPSPLLCGHPAATCDLRLRKTGPFLRVVHLLGPAPEKS